MPDFPATVGGELLAINALGDQTGPGPVLNTNNNTWSVTATGWAAGNQVLYIPFWVEQPGFTAKQMIVNNAGTVSGNVDVGIYDWAGNRLVSNGTTAMSGASVCQVFNITDTDLPPGYYFMAMQASTTAATFRTTGPNAQISRITGCRQDTTSAAGLPATATFTAYTAGLIPCFSVLGFTTAA